MMADLPFDPLMYATPLFAVLIGVEIVVLRRRARNPIVASALVPSLEPLGYDRRDAVASIALGAFSILPVLLLNLGVLVIATWLWQWRLWDLGNGVRGWVVAIVAWDFMYYCQHRAEHEVRILWACHVNHHSSQRYNLSTAIRQPWTPWTHLVFYPGLALIGVRPWMILAAEGFDLIFQFWIHTEAIDRLPAPFELLFNTASHHRVHHGSNPQYLDKNYGGILIIWDRLFGTFEPEDERVVYGLTKNIDTYSPVRIAFHEYAAIWRDLRSTRSIADRARVLFKGPGWRPELEPAALAVELEPHRL